MEVRRITADDGRLFRDLRLRALRDAPDAFASSYAENAARTDAEWQARATEAAASRWSAYFFARHAGRPCGMAGGYRTEDEPDLVHLIAMWVAPQCRKRGAAALLTEAVVAWAAEVGAGTVALWVVDGNDPARRVYEAAGFRDDGSAQPLPSNPALVERRMTRPVA